MKKTSLNSIAIIVIINIFIISCDSDPCDEGYTQLDNGVCVPDFIVGIEQDFELVNIFYHTEYGVVTYKNGNWYDSENLIIENINE